MTIKNKFLALLLAFFSFFAHAKNTEIHVYTSLDITQVMGEALVENTSIHMEKIIPDGYSLQGHNAYFRKHQKTFLNRVKNADAVFTLASVWEKDPLYKWARRANIRVVNIDVALPLDGYGAGVPLIEIEGKYLPYVWRSPANLTRMATIAAEDLIKLSPDDEQTIHCNLKKLQTALFLLRSKYEMAFLELTSTDLLALTTQNAYLTDEFSLNVHAYFLKPEYEWKKSDLQALRQNLKENKIKTVLCAWKPEGEILQAIKESDASTVVLTPFVYDKNKAPINMLSEWYESNLARLLKALKN